MFGSIGQYKQKYRLYIQNSQHTLLAINDVNAKLKIEKMVVMSNDLMKITNKTIILYFVIMFILGNLIIGFLESAFYEYGYYYKVFNIINSKRMLSFFNYALQCLFLGYSIFSFIIIFKKLKYSTSFKLFFVVYYFAFVWIYTFYKYSSPISYLSSFIYNGFSNNCWDNDILTYYKNINI